MSLMNLFRGTQGDRDQIPSTPHAMWKFYYYHNKMHVQPHTQFTRHHEHRASGLRSYRSLVSVCFLICLLSIYVIPGYGRVMDDPFRPSTNRVGASTQKDGDLRIVSLMNWNELPRTNDMTRSENSSFRPRWMLHDRDGIFATCRCHMGINKLFSSLHHEYYILAIYWGASGINPSQWFSQKVMMNR